MTATRAGRIGRVRSVFGKAAFRLGRIAKRPMLAEIAYSGALVFNPYSTRVLYRLGKARESTRDWTGAERAYSAGIALGPDEVAAYLTRRAYVLERQGRWAEAIADCRARPDVEPPRRLLRRLAEAYRQDGRLPEAITTYELAVEVRPTAKLLAALAECQLSHGALGTARRTYAAAVDMAPDNLSIRVALGRAAARHSIVPFELAGGHLSTVGMADRERARAQAESAFRHVLRVDESRLWVSYSLGRLLETHRLLADALSAYEGAIGQLQAVDATWAHGTEQAWRFRRDYVAHKVAGTTSTDVRFNRAVSPGKPGADLSAAGGFFEASVTNVGLHIEGFVVHGHKGSVELYLDGLHILSVSTSSSAWHEEFRTTIVHGIVGEFPTRAKLTLRVGNARLVTMNGALSIDVIVPDGSGKLRAMLGGGRTITKKGRWSDAVLRTGSNDSQFFIGYAKAKAFFEEEFGFKLFLSYGTLLGCYRDGQLIPDDDDFDVSYVSDATGPDELKEEGRSIIQALLRAGYDARVAIDGRMLHLRVGDVVLDVNPFWFYEGRAWSFDSHRLDRDVFHPVTTIRVDGVEVYIPGKAEEFLTENYGPDWRTPRSDFQYHRSKDDVKTLRQARLVPSEVRALEDYAEELRASDPSAGRFYGYADPANPLFG